MKSLPIAVAILLAATSGVLAAEQTWTGQISDSGCGATHMSADKHGARMTDKRCTEACIKQDKSKYVFVTDGHVFTIANQNEKLLSSGAGQAVRLTGTLKGDAVTVSALEVLPVAGNKRR